MRMPDLRAIFASLRDRWRTSADAPRSTPHAPALDCSTRYTAHLVGRTRSTTALRVIVVHSTEGATAAGAAAWFANAASKGSAHVVIDDAACFRTVADDRIAYGAHPFNDDGLHVEIAGFARWTRAEWLDVTPRIERAARVIATWCRAYGIPAELLTEQQIAASRATVRGIATHAAIVRATGTGSHWDPGPGFPLDVLLSTVRAFLASDDR